MKFKKITKIFTIIMSIFILNFLTILNCVNAVNLKEISIQSSGECGSLLTYKGIVVKAHYTQYTLDGVSYPAYCLDKTKPGVTDDISYQVSIEDSIHDIILWRYIINGYPYKSFQELGVANKEEAFTATKQAIYCYIHGNDVNSYGAIGEAGQRTLNALKKIVANAKSSTETMASNHIEIIPNKEAFKPDNLEPNYLSRTYQVKASAALSNYKVTIQKGEKELLEGIKIVDSKNKEKAEFSSNETFKVLIPIRNIKEEGDFKLHLETKVKTKPVIYGKAPNSAYQDYALTAAMFEDSVQDLTDKYPKNQAKIKIKKQDEETKKPLGDVEFSLLNEQKQVVYANLKTNEQGEIEVKNLMPGTYYIKETVSKQGYLPNEELTKVELKWNHSATVTVFNLKEDEKKTNIEIEETEFSTSVKRLPVTGM